MTSKRVALVGAGPAGMATARALARNGIDVVLLEQGDRIGGAARDYACKGTDTCNKCNVCLATDLSREVRALPHVQILTGHRVSSIERDGQRFHITAGMEKLEADAVVLAAGFDPFDARLRPELGYGRCPAVVSALDLERRLKSGDRIEDLIGRSPRKVGFIQCVGSRNTREGRGYCSRVCCMYSLRLAKVLRHEFPETDISLFYMDFQGAGKAPDEVRRIAEARDRIRFVRGMPGEIEGLPDGRASIGYEDPGTSRCEREEFDLVVLAVGTLPHGDGQMLARQVGLACDEHGFVKPVLECGEPKTPAPGVFVAGSLSGPKNIAEAVADGEQTAFYVLQYLASREAARVAFSFPESSRTTRKVPAEGHGAAAVQAEKTVLVLGGGLAGMEAAKACSELGCRAVIVERGESLQVSSRPEAALAVRIQEDESIEVLTSRRLVDLQGTTCKFSATLAGPDGSTSRVSAGAVIAAVGCEYRPPQLVGEAQGRPEVMELSKLESAGAPWGDSGDWKGRVVAFCLGGRPDVARAASEQVLASALSASSSGYEVFVIARDVGVSGGPCENAEEAYKKAREAGVIFIKYRREPRLDVNNGKLAISVEDDTLGEDKDGSSACTVTIPVDMLVVVEEAYPHHDADELAETLKINVGPHGFFQDDNVNLLPVLTNRRGIYVAGACRGALTMSEAICDARVAAYLAASLVGSGEARIDWVTATVDAEKCALCLTCIRTCPHHAITVDTEARAARVDKIACWGCGSCAAECPGKAIQLEAFTDDEIESQLKPAVTAFCCERSAYLAAEAAVAAGMIEEDQVNIVKVPCAGKVDILHVLHAMERGAGAVMIAGCFEEGCHYIRGNTRARRRHGRVAEVLQEIGLDPQRARFYQIGPEMGAAFAQAALETLRYAERGERVAGRDDR